MNFQIGIKGGQDFKKKKDDIVLVQKHPEHVLKLKVKSFDEDVGDIVTDLITELGGIDEATLVIPGGKEECEKNAKAAAALIAKVGGQQTLDLHFGDDKDAA